MLQITNVQERRGEVLQCEMESEKHLNFLLRNMVSKSMVKGIMANLVICTREAK